jgi:hypothetical protein
MRARFVDRSASFWTEIVPLLPGISKAGRSRSMAARLIMPR